MSTFVSTVAIKSKRWDVPVAAPVVIQTINIPVPASLAAVVGASGSMLIEYTLTPTDTPNWAAVAVWTPWSLGTAGVVTVNTFGTVTSPIVAIRATATTADGAVEICA